MKSNAGKFAIGHLNLDEVRHFQIDFRGQALTLYHIKDVARFIGFSVEGVKRWRRKGILPDSHFYSKMKTNLIRGHMDGCIVTEGRKYYYTREEVLILKYLVGKYGFTAVKHETFRRNVRQWFNQVRERYDAGQGVDDLTPVILMFKNQSEFDNHFRIVSAAHVIHP